MKMHSGKLRHRITIQQEVKGKSPNGFKQHSIEEIRQTWAHIETQTSSKEIENDQLIEEVSTVFVIRYQDIQKDYQISYQGKTYEIKTIEDKDFRRMFLTLGTKEVIG